MSSYTAKQKAIAIAPKFTSLLSVLGSSFIIYEIVKDKRKLGTTFHRILLGMCICDASSSLWFFLGTWPIPRGTEGVFGAVGTQGSCIAQGFFSQLSLTTAMYNASLSVFYLLQIRNGWKSDRIRRQAEPWLHATALAIGLGTSLAGIFLNLYNNDYWECWIAPLPTDCKESWKHEPGEGDCVRGDNASLYRWCFYYAPLWAAIVAVTVCMFLVYRSVLRHEKAAERHSLVERERKFSKKVAKQGYYYCGAFYLTWMFPTITRLTQVIIGDATPFWLICLTAMFVPIQGALNFVVYIRPRYKKYRAARAIVNEVEYLENRFCCCLMWKERRRARSSGTERFSLAFYSRGERGSSLVPMSKHGIGNTKHGSGSGSKQKSSDQSNAEGGKVQRSSQSDDNHSLPEEKKEEELIKQEEEREGWREVFAQVANDDDDDEIMDEQEEGRQQQSQRESRSSDDREEYDLESTEVHHNACK